MFGKEDNTYNELREKSVSQWLDDMSHHEDIEVRGGTELTKDYIEDLKKKIGLLEKKNTLKDKYLRRLKRKKDQINL
ncbi:MAG: hypothetical protein JEZ08_21340 [Clostridiales bacterium]|nr:hypothetical protein [Clostridiales bacterium]